MDTKEQVLEMKRRVLNGEHIPDEEYAEILSVLRGDRHSGSGSRKSEISSNLPDNLDDLFK